jgi:hypothetical protein
LKWRERLAKKKESILQRGVNDAKKEVASEEDDMKKDSNNKEQDD